MPPTLAVRAWCLQPAVLRLFRLKCADLRPESRKVVSVFFTKFESGQAPCWRVRRVHGATPSTGRCAVAAKLRGFARFCAVLRHGARRTPRAYVAPKERPDSAALAVLTATVPLRLCGLGA